MILAIPKNIQNLVVQAFYVKGRVVFIRIEEVQTKSVNMDWHILDNWLWQKRFVPMVVIYYKQA